MDPRLPPKKPLDPEVENLINDPLWKVKARRVVSHTKSNAGTYIVIGVVIVFVLVTWLG